MARYVVINRKLNYIISKPTNLETAMKYKDLLNKNAEASGSPQCYDFEAYKAPPKRREKKSENDIRNGNK